MRLCGGGCGHGGGGRCGGFRRVRLCWRNRLGRARSRRRQRRRLCRSGDGGGLGGGGRFGGGRLGSNRLAARVLCGRFGSRLRSRRGRLFARPTGRRCLCVGGRRRRLWRLCGRRRFRWRWSTADGRRGAECCIRGPSTRVRGRGGRACGRLRTTSAIVIRRGSRPLDLRCLAVPRWNGQRTLLRLDILCEREASDLNLVSKKRKCAREVG